MRSRKKVLLLLVVTSLLWSLAAALEKDANVKEKKEPFNKDPKYNYAFGIEDKEEKLFHAHKQNRDDKVVTGEYSWVDPLGSRHTVVYRADEEGFKILETREEKGFVKVPASSENQVKTEKTTKKKEKQVQKVTLRVPKSRGSEALATPTIDPRRTGVTRPARKRKLIRVIKKRPRVNNQQKLRQQQLLEQAVVKSEVNQDQDTSVLKVVRFKEPNTQVVDLQTVPQKIELPKSTVQEEVATEGPVEVRPNVFFVPRKSQPEKKKKKDDDFVLTETPSATITQGEDKTVVVLKRNQKRPVKLPRAKVLKKLVATANGTPVKKVEQQATPTLPSVTPKKVQGKPRKVVVTVPQLVEEPATVAPAVELEEKPRSGKNRHFDPKSFRTTRLEPKNLAEFNARPAAVPKPSVRNTALLAAQQEETIVSQPVAQTVVASPQSVVPQTVNVAASPLARQVIRTRPTRPAVAPAPVNQVPLDLQSRPRIRFVSTPASPLPLPTLPSEIPSPATPSVDLPPPPQPVLRFISLPVKQQQQQQQNVPLEAVQQDVSQQQQSSAGVRLIPFATFPQPQHGIQQQQTRIVFDPQFRTVQQPSQPAATTTTTSSGQSSSATNFAAASSPAAGVAVATARPLVGLGVQPSEFLDTQQQPKQPKQKAKQPRKHVQQARRQPQLVSQQTQFVSRQPQLLPQQPQLLSQQPQLLSQQPQLLPQQPHLVPQQPQLLPQQQIISQQPRLVPKQPRVISQQPRLVPVPLQPQLVAQPQPRIVTKQQLIPQQPQVLNQHPQLVPQQPQLVTKQVVPQQPKTVSTRQRDGPVFVQVHPVAFASHSNQSPFLRVFHEGLPRSSPTLASSPAATTRQISLVNSVQAHELTPVSFAPGPATVSFSSPNIRYEY